METWNETGRAAMTTGMPPTGIQQPINLTCLWSGGIECPAVCDFFGSLFLDTLYIFESLKCMHNYQEVQKVLNMA